jgi:beta-lactamase superfamily II metal-dependent hydrolase
MTAAFSGGTQMKLTGISSLLAVLLLVPVTAQARTPETLDIYFIDVEGGSATLFVTSEGESLLVDSGFPGDRDAERIADVATNLAKLKQLDHYITTHWHRDHFGGSNRLAQMVPIKRFYDRGLPSLPAVDIQPELIAVYRKTSRGKSKSMKLNDEIKFKGPARLRVLTVKGMVIGEKKPSPQIQPCGADFRPQPEDKTDNANSIGYLLTFGSFKFFSGGDLTWNVEHKLVCPQNLVGAVDLYLVDHHGADTSNNPALIAGMKPRVAVINNGPRKAGEVQTFAYLKSEPSIEAIYQLHRNLTTTANDNAAPDFVANDDEACQASYIKVSVSLDGTYEVSIPAKGIKREYRVR